MKLIHGTLGAVVLGVIIGCGGGGGSNGSSDGGSTGTTPAGTVFKTLTPVIIYTYGLSGTATVASVPKTIATGQRVLEVDTSTQSGATVLLSATDSISLTDTTTSGFFLRNYVSQDAGSHDISLNALDFGTGIKPLSLAQVLLPGTFTGTTSVSKSYTYTGGPGVYSLTPEATENVTVPAGTYQTYRMHGSFDFGSGYTRVGTYWYSPSVGTYVKATEVVTEPGKTETITAVLESISTP